MSSSQFIESQDDPKTIIPIVNAIINASIDTSIKGFEREPSVIRLNKEWHDLQNANNLVLALPKKQALHVEKIRIVVQREKFNDKIQNVDHILNIGDAFSRLSDNSHLGKSVAIAQASLKVGAVVAGLAGYGALAGMVTPLMGVSLVMGGMAQIDALLNSNSNPMEYLAEQLQQISMQLQHLQEMLIESHREIIQGLNDAARERFLNYNGLRSNNESMKASMEAHQIRSSHNEELLKSYSQRVMQDLASVEQAIIANQKKQTLRDLRLSVNESIDIAMNSTSMNHGYDSARAKIRSLIATADAGAQHSDLTGKKLLTSNEKIEAELSVHPYFLLNTLYGIYREFNLPPNLLSLEKLEERFKMHVGNYERFKLTRIHQCKDLLCSNPSNPHIKVESLFATVHEAIQNYKIHLIPLFINGNYSLIIYDSNESIAYYFSLPNQDDYTAKIKLILNRAGVDIWRIKAFVLHQAISPTLSAQWIDTALKQLASSEKKLQDGITDLINIRPEHLESLNIPYTEITIYNPLICQFLTLKLLEMTYSVHPELGEGSVNMIGDELILLQQLCLANESFYQLYTTFCNTKLFDKIFENYTKALKKFENALRMHLNEFNNTFSHEMNLKTKQVAEETIYSDTETRNFVGSVPSIGLYGNWFTENWVERTKNPPWSHSYDNARGYDIKYKNDRHNEIVNVKTKYVEANQAAFRAKELDNQYSVFNGNRYENIPLPYKIIPEEKTDPEMVASYRFFDLLENDIKNYIIGNINVGFGKLIYTYTIISIKESNTESLHYCFKIIYESHQPKTAFVLLEFTAPHNQLFYNNAEARYWDYMGGNCATQLSGVKFKTFTEQTGPWYHCFTKVPVLEQRQGLLEKINNDPSILKVIRRADLASLPPSPFEKYINERYLTSLTEKTDVGSVKEALSELNIWFKILEKFFIFLFPNVNENSLAHTFFFESPSINNRERLLQHLLQFPAVFAAENLTSLSVINDLQLEINTLIKSSNSLMRTPNVDNLQNLLFVAMNHVIKNIKGKRTVNEEATLFKKMSQVTDSMLSEFMPILSEQNPELANMLRRALDAKQQLEASLTNSEVGMPLPSAVSLLLPSETNSISFSSGSSFTASSNSVSRAHGRFFNQTNENTVDQNNSAANRYHL